MWDELGIAPSDDPKTIRRAYAARLKTLDPDRDPAAFARLRRAFEWALARTDGANGSASERSRPAQPRDPIPANDDSLHAADVVTPPEDQTEQDIGIFPASDRAAFPRHDIEPSLDLLDEPSLDRALLIALDSALRRRDAGEATRLYYRAAATGALSLREAADMLERFLAVVVEDTTFDRVAFRELAKCFGWDKLGRGDAATSELRQRVLSRLAAEDWYDSLLAHADRKKVTPRKAKVARLLLKRIRRPWLFRIDRPMLTTCLDEYRTHETWLRDRIDPAWAVTLEDRVRRRDVLANVLIASIIAAMLIQGVNVFVMELSEGLPSVGLLLISPIFAAILLWILKIVLTQVVRLSISPRTGRRGSTPPPSHLPPPG